MTNIPMWYKVPAFIVGGIVFLGIWIFSLASWGFLLGLMIGWIPALIGGVIAGVLWPLVVLAMVCLIFLIMNAH